MQATDDAREDFRRQQVRRLGWLAGDAQVDLTDHAVRRLSLDICYPPFMTPAGQLPKPQPVNKVTNLYSYA